MLCATCSNTCHYELKRGTVALKILGVSDAAPRVVRRLFCFNSSVLQTVHKIVALKYEVVISELYFKLIFFLCFHHYLHFMACFVHDDFFSSPLNPPLHCYQCILTLLLASRSLLKWICINCFTVLHLSRKNILTVLLLCLVEVSMMYCMGWFIL